MIREPGWKIVAEGYQICVRTPGRLAGRLCGPSPLFCGDQA